MVLSLNLTQQRYLSALTVSMMANLGLLVLMAWLHYVTEPYAKIPAIPIKLLPLAKELEIAKPSASKNKTKSLVPKKDSAPMVPAVVTDSPPINNQIDEAVSSEKYAIEPLHRVTRLPQFLRRIEPVYPEDQRAVGQEAMVLVELVIDTRGRILETRIVKSAGKEFDKAVMLALEQSLFSPAYIDDREVVVRFQIPFRFQLR